MLYVLLKSVSNSIILDINKKIKINLEKIHIYLDGL
jgi:hypothetical protein